MKTCCGCSLRAGSFAAGVYTLVIALIMISLACVAYIDDAFRGTVDVGGKKIGEALTVYKGALIATAVVEGMFAISAILLFVGIKKEVTGLLIPWIVITWVLVVLETVGIIRFVVSFFSVHISGLVVLLLLGKAVITALELYSVACVMSFRTELISRRSQLLSSGDDVTGHVNNAIMDDGDCAMLVVSGDETIVSVEDQKERPSPPPYCY